MLKILVIDEDYRARYAISRILGDNGYEVLTAADDARGLYLLDRESPDIVIIDIVMTPETDGIETVSKMRDRCPQTRIVGLSGVSVAGILDPMQAAITLGVHDLICKPLHPTEVLRCVGQSHALSADLQPS